MDSSGANLVHYIVLGLLAPTPLKFEVIQRPIVKINQEAGHFVAIMMIINHDMLLKTFKKMK